MRCLLTVLLLPLSLTVGAQWDSMVSIGAIAVQQQDYQKAVSYLREALQHESELKEKNVVKAYYNLADALIRESQRQMSVQGENTERKYAEYVFEAADALTNARRLPDGQGRYGKQIDIRVNTVFNSLMMTVVQLTNSAASAGADGTGPYMKEMLRVCSAIIQLKPGHYIGFDYRGQTYLSLHDSAKAYSDLTDAIRLYESDAANEPDAMAGHIYYRAALIESYGHRNDKKALELLRAGLSKNLSDRSIVAASTEMTGDRKKSILEKFSDTEKDLKLFRLDILQRLPDPTEAESHEFEQSVTEFPKNSNVQLVYAQRIQDERPQAAIEIYDRILAVEPDNTTALFNAGVLYYNRAANLLEQAGEEKNVKSNDDSLVHQLFREAIPYFEKACSLGETSSAQALRTIADYLGDSELNEKYK